MAAAATLRLSNPASPADPLERLAYRGLGVAYLFPYQRLVVANAIEGRNQIVLLPTGAGKSLCFMLPATILAGLTLVIVPLLSLMEDLRRRMNEAGLAVDVLRGGQTRAERGEALAAARAGRLRIVLTTPETAQVRAAALAACRIEHLVVDEAHCISTWGNSFRPSYRQLGQVVDQIGPRLISAFTATASQRITDDVRANLFGRRPVHVVAGNPDRPNIRYRVQPTVAPLRSLVHLVATGMRPLLAFARSRRGTELAARHIRRVYPGVDTRFYHAGLTAPERAMAERWFLSANDGALIATSAYGMGVDKPDIRTVAHVGLSESVEAYLQETGRAGRDGSPASAVLFHLSAGGVSRPEADRAGGGSSRGDLLLEYAERQTECRRAQLLSHFRQERVECAGCDVCDANATGISTEEQRALRALRRGSRRFTASQWQSILMGGAVDGHRRAPGYGALHDWDADEVAELIETLQALQLASVPRRGPWRRRVRVSRVPRPQLLAV